jgi:hypothetical protein
MMAMFGKKALLFAMDEIPEHIQQTFCISPNWHEKGYHCAPELDYTVIVLGDSIPTDITEFFLFYYRDEYHTNLAFELVAQIEHLIPGVRWTGFPVFE